jgi:two-component system chemotaxis response regulator CheY
LLADDSVTAQNMGRKILADAGYEVIAVNNGSAALKKIAELKPDLVILDVYMPGYSGLEVCQRLKESQETARIPVLLTVGKLEPFKPEEAQRVRAEGFIVKPFEASELLSALSKLEDKVVPRSEPSKPGRFARAIAAAEESGRGGWSEAASGDHGWKSRIGFPPQKAEPEEKVADDASIYNPMNRDLRTVVEKPAPSNEATQPAAEKNPETSVDVAAVVSAGMPKDVTPEEVAAIANAAAQLQMVSGKNGGNQASEAQSSETEGAAALRAPSDNREENSGTPPQGGSEPQVQEEAKTAALGQTMVEGISEAAAAETATAVCAEPQDDLPVTMAATAESVVAARVERSHWTAVSVALGGEDGAISLEEEMQKAQAAFAAAEMGPAVGVTVPQPEPAPAEHSSSLSQPVAEVQVTAISVPALEHAIVSAPALAGPVATAQFEAGDQPSDLAAAEPAILPECAIEPSAQLERAGPASAAGAISPIEAESHTTPIAGSAELTRDPAPVAEFAVSAVAEEVATPGEHEIQSAPEPEPPVAQATMASTDADAPSVHEGDREPEDKPESEVVKNTAAAWASWRQIRDSGDSKRGEAAQARPQEFEVPQSAPAEASAMAVAAGAEQIAREVSAAAPSENPADLASIVDSVLADLRPKLMAEISRKMSEKK